MLSKISRTLLISLLIIMSVYIHAETVRNACGAVLLDRVVATVNNEVITWSELMSVVLIEGKEILGNLSDEERKDKINQLEKPFLNSLVEMKLQLQEARRLGLGVGSAEIEGAINDIKNKFGMTDEILKNSLTAEGLTMSDYRSRLGDQILLQKVVNHAVKSSVVISDKEIEAYYEEHKEEYSEKEKLKIRQIFFMRHQDESQNVVIEAKAQEILQRISRGEDFAELAREFSQGPNREAGGDLGYITRGSVLKEIEEAAFALKAGEVSGAFWSPAGLHIIKLDERIAGGGIETVRDRIKKILFQKAFESQYHEWRSSLKENAYIDIKL